MKILVADDHELFLKGLELILSDNYPDAQLVFAKDYSEIFKIIDEQKDFNLVLTDLAMPGSQWLDAIQKIHLTLPETPIIILSAVFDKEIVQKSIEIGAAGSAVQPVPIKRIARKNAKIRFIKNLLLCHFWDQRFFNGDPLIIGLPSAGRIFLR